MGEVVPFVKQQKVKIIQQQLLLARLSFERNEALRASRNAWRALAILLGALYAGLVLLVGIRGG